MLLVLSCCSGYCKFDGAYMGLPTLRTGSLCLRLVFKIAKSIYSTLYIEMGRQV